MKSKYFPIQSFVPKEVYTSFGERSWQFVSNSIVALADFTHEFFNEHYKALDSNVERVEVVINNYHDSTLIKILGQVFNWRGLRTYKYIDGLVEAGKAVATMSQHIGGSTNAIDFNIILHFKGGKTLIINSGDINDIILKNKEKFLAHGLTTLEDKTITKGWTHGDCRFTGLVNEILIVKP